MTLLESNKILCAEIKFACVCSCQNHVTLLELMADYVLALNSHVCVHAKIMWFCWNIMTDYVLELNLMCVHAKIMWLYWKLIINCVVYSELAFAAKIILCAANQRSLLKLCCVQWISIRCQKLTCLQRVSVRWWKLCYLQRVSVCCLNCIMCNESALIVKNLCCLQRINIRCWNCVVCSSQNCVVCRDAFAAEIMLSIAN